MYSCLRSSPCDRQEVSRPKGIARSGGRLSRRPEEALRAAAAEEELHIGEFDQHSLWGALDAIAEQCRRRREPPLDVLVVSKDTGRPGRGYWQKHAFLPGDGDDLEKLVFERHLAAVRASNWSQDV